MIGGQYARLKGNLLMDTRFGKRASHFSERLSWMAGAHCAQPQALSHFQLSDQDCLAEIDKPQHCYHSEDQRNTINSTLRKTDAHMSDNFFPISSLGASSSGE